VKTAAAVRAAVVFLLLALSGTAQQLSDLRPTGYVNDFAHVLAAKTSAQIENICEQVDEKAHAQIAVVTVSSLQGADIDTYAVAVFKRWGIGNKSTNRGVLILLAIQDRRYRIEVGYGLEPILPDGKVGGFGREAVPYLKTGDYDGALLLLTTRVATVIAEDAHVEITSAGQDTVPAAPEAEPQAGPSAGTIALVVIVILCLLIFTPLRRLLFWWLLFGGGGRWGGRSSGGSWGGGGFGRGGFGGFGGGSSGGGGASGSW
jgi:uncharacterized protein